MRGLFLTNSNLFDSPMRVLFISGELIANELVSLLQLEGHQVRLFIKEVALRDCCSGFVDIIDDWEANLAWAGKEGLIIFDDIGFGEKQDNLRKQGYRVVGGSALGDRLEIDRAYGQEVFGRYGIRQSPAFNFTSVREAIKHVQSTTGKQWVVKLNGSQHVSTSNYVGQLPDGRDVINILKRYQDTDHHVHLQQKIEGVEVGIGRFFNGDDWVGPIEINFEHKSLMPGGIGPKTPEMGTLMWYDEDESNILFRETLFKLSQHLREIGFHGDFDVNCIVNGEGVWPLEATARFGDPSTAMQAELHLSPWGEFLGAIADKHQYKLNFKRGYGIVVTVAIPPFPYEYLSSEYASKDIEIYFREPVSEEDILRHYFFEEVSRIKKGSQDFQYIVKGHKGCVAHVTGFGETIEKARQEAYARVENLIIPKMFYRKDIGQRFIDTERASLEAWGYLKRASV